MADDDRQQQYGYYVEEPSFAVHSPLGSLNPKTVGRILAIRYQDACIDDFDADDVRIIENDGDGDEDDEERGGGQQQQHGANGGGDRSHAYAAPSRPSSSVDPSCPVAVVFIERAADDGFATVTHAYTPVPSVAEYLRTTNDPILAEDAAFLSFLIAGGSDATSSLLLRSGFHKRLKPVHEENRRLKEELKAMQRDNQQLRASLQNARSGNVSAAAAAVNMTTNTISTIGGGGNEYPNNNTSGGGNNSTNNTNDAAISVHSPHKWELETEAAINARTRYNPYRDEETKARRRRNRHGESVGQLVARLYYKSCDERDRRLASYDEVIRRENERYNERRTLNDDEVHDLGVRLHDTSAAKKKKMIEELDKTYYPPTERRTFDKEAILKSNDRIYREPMEKKQKGLEKLVQMYVYDKDEKLPKLKLSKEQEQAMADRLSQKR